MRIQKLISQRGVASRRKAEQMILDGRITINGAPCDLGVLVDPEKDVVCIDGKPLPQEQNKVYILLNKPRGYVTTLSDEKNRPTAAQLVKDCGLRVYPCGRLDCDSEGLLLFTNDGEFANSMMHPRHEVNKVYSVLVKGCTEQALQRLREPMELDGYPIRRPGIKLVRNGEPAVVEITIHEGRNRQVRRMCALAGMTVLRLKRIREGTISLGNLKPGKWRYLTQDEVNELK